MRRCTYGGGHAGPPLQFLRSEGPAVSSRARKGVDHLQEYFVSAERATRFVPGLLPETGGPREISKANPALTGGASN